MNQTALEGSFIPASQRPDGTWRKARRVKEGYVPQEEVPLYESKGKQFANRRSQPQSAVPLLPGQNAHKSIPGLYIISNETKGNSKKKESTKVAEITQKIAKVDINKESDPTKRLRNLKKRLREIEKLEQQIASGEIKKPEKEQLDKVNRKKDVLSEIKKLESCT